MTLDEIKAAMGELLDERLEAKLNGAGGIKTSNGGTETKAAAEVAQPVVSMVNFKSYIRTGVDAGLVKVAEDGSIKALGEQSNSAGAVLVPKELHDELITLQTQFSVLRAAGARVIPKTGTNSFTVPRLSAPTTPLPLVAEHGTITEEDPNFGSVEFKPYKYPKITRVSDELMADSAFDVERQVMVPYAAQAFAVTENSVFATGTGTGQPEGIVTGSTLGRTSATAGGTTITYADLSALFFSVPAGLRNRAVWLFGDAATTQIDQMTIGNSKILTTDATGNLTLMGRPFYTLSTLANPAVNAIVGLFGVMDYFWIVEFGGVDIKRLNEKYADTGQIGFRWQERVDSHVIHPQAIKHLRMAAA